MRIFLITTKLNFETSGGSVLDLHNKARGLEEFGHDITVVTTYSRGNKYVPKKLPYKVFEEYLTSHGLLGNQMGVYKILKKYETRADVYYVDGQIFVYGAGLYKLLGGKVPVLSFFKLGLNCWADPVGNIPTSQLSLWKRLKKKLRRYLEHRLGVLLANYNNALAFVNPYVEKKYLAWGFEVKKSIIVEDCINTGDIIRQEKLSESKIKQHQQNPQTLQLLSTGRMFPEKGFAILIQAFQLLENKDRFKVIISGRGPEHRRLGELIKELNLEKYISMPGWVDRDKLAEYFRTSHIFIFPKWWLEYSSQVLVEAMAYGLPCIIPGGGALEWLTQGRTETYEMGNINDLAAKIEKLAVNPKLRTRLGINLLHRAEELNYKNQVSKLNHAMISIVKHRNLHKLI